MTSTATATPDAAAERPSDAAMLRQLGGVPAIDLVPHVRAAMRRHGQSATRMMRDIWRLSRGPGGLSVQEYFYYRLYDGALSAEARRQFVGKRAQARFHAQCNSAAWFAVVHDKLLFQAAMSGLGFPTPELFALVHPSRRFGDRPSLRSADELAGFLRNHGAAPLYAKPIDGMFSLGGYSIDRIDREADAVDLAYGEHLTIAELAAEIAGSSFDGYLLQERLRPHAEIAEAFGGRLATLRLLVLLTARGPEVFRAVLKIPAGRNIADNFWRPGNMLGAVDPESGRVLRVVSGVGEAQAEHACHPDTGAALPGMCVPDWRTTVELCLDAGASVHGVRTQGWDVALTDRGPMLLELNFGGDLNLPQIAYGRGVLDDRFKAHLRACGYTGLPN